MEGKKKEMRSIKDSKEGDKNKTKKGRTEGEIEKDGGHREGRGDTSGRDRAKENQEKYKVGGRNKQGSKQPD